MQLLQDTPVGRRRDGYGSLDRVRCAAVRAVLGVSLAIGTVSPVALLAGCGKSDAKAAAGQQAPQAVPVDTAAARVDSVQRSVEVVGTLFGEEDATISNKVPGRLIAIYKDIGDRVAPGEPLAQLLRNDYLLDLNLKRAAVLESLSKVGLTELPPDNFDVANVPAVRQAQLQARNAESRFNRGRQLHEQQPPLMSDQDFEDLRTALDVARAAYDAAVLAAKGLLGEARTRHAEMLQAEQALRDSTIRAPAESYAPPKFNKGVVDLNAVVSGTADPARGGVAVAAASDDDGAPGAATTPTTQPGGTSVAAPDAQSVPTTQPGLAPLPAVATQPSVTPATAMATGRATAPSTAAAGRHSYVVAARFRNVGELVPAITPQFRLVDDDPLKLRAAVPERYFPEVGVGQRVTITTAAYPTPFDGTVTRVSPQVDAANRTFPVEIAVPNADHRLTPGAFANAAIRTRVEPGVVFVPASAVVTFAGVDKVYVIKDGKAQEVLVTLGDRRADEFEVRKGLKGGETVATSGTSRLATGVPVLVKAGK